VRHVVANGEEGEPTSLKDRYLLRVRPHLVIDGMLRTARAVGATDLVIYLADHTAERSALLALTELDESDVRVDAGIEIEVVAVERSYIGGEETAAVRAIDGGPAKPTTKPPRPFEIGVSGEPTLVQNVETIANVPFIALHGDEGFRAYGTERSPGTILFTACGRCTAPGLYEIPLGLPMAEIFDLAGGFSESPRGFLMGGYFAGMLGARGVELPVTYDELREAGSGLGCGAVTAFGVHDCPVCVAAEVMSYFSDEQSGQCGVCTRGTASMADALQALAVATAKEEQLRNLARWSQSLRGRGACALLDGAATLAATLLREFPGIVDAHLRSCCEICRAQPEHRELRVVVAR
jgi:NADH:ubiquinone oxidoreductase subunit F (NADH-binding)